MIKKVLGFTASTLIVAGAATPAMATSDMLGGLMFRAQGHYMEPTNERAIVATRAVDAGNNIAGESFFMEPGGDWDYRLGLEYTLPGDSNTTLVLDYDNYSAGDSRDVDNANGAITLNSLHGGANPLNANGQIKYKDQAFKLGARRGLEFGDNFDLNAGAYLEYAKVERAYRVTEFSAANAGTILNAEFETSGWGPSFDLEGVWHPMGRHSCFTVNVGAELATLWADDKYQVSLVNQAGALVAGDINQSNREDLSSIMTRLGATAAVGYSRPMNDTLALGIKAGARWVNYVNAFDGASGLEAGRTDYGRFGPFIELRIGGVDSNV